MCPLYYTIPVRSFLLIMYDNQGLESVTFPDLRTPEFQRNSRNFLEGLELQPLPADHSWQLTSLTRLNLGGLPSEDVYEVFSHLKNLKICTVYVEFDHQSQSSHFVDLPELPHLDELHLSVWSRDSEGLPAWNWPFDPPKLLRLVKQIPQVRHLELIMSNGVMTGDSSRPITNYTLIELAGLLPCLESFELAVRCAGRVVDTSKDAKFANLHLSSNFRNRTSSIFLQRRPW
jgi:hypothetical protein